jgi:hypothetical protein
MPNAISSTLIVAGNVISRMPNVRPTVCVICCHAGGAISPHRAIAAEFSEFSDVLELDREFAQRFVFGLNSLHASEMQHGIEPHRGMPVGQRKAIAIGSDRIVGVEPEKTLPQDIDHRCKCHGRARMTGSGLLHGIDRKGATSIDAKLIDRAILFGFRAQCFKRSDRRRFDFDWQDRSGAAIRPELRSSFPAGIIDSPPRPLLHFGSLL